jgi:transcriptional regulator with XRE-family HTH domain
MNKKDLRDRIQQIRDYYGLSQKDFSREIGMSQGNYSKIESGEVKASNTLILAIMGRFAISPDWIKTGEGEMLVAPEEYIEKGITLLGAQKFSEGLNMILKNPRFGEFRSLVGVGEIAQDNFDENLKTFVEYILNQGHQGDERVRTWLMVQLERSFPKAMENISKEK